MTRYHVVTDAKSGETNTIPFTPEEEAAADAYKPPLPDLYPYQFFAMLELSGKKSVLDAFIDALPSPQNVTARAKLDRSLAFHRDNDLVLAAQQALKLTDDQLDALWTQASTL